MAMVVDSYAAPSSGLKRTRSGNFSTTTHTAFSSSPSKSQFSLGGGHHTFDHLPSPRNTPNHSPASSPTVEHAESISTLHESYQSTPASSIDHNLCTDSEDEDQIIFPSYDDVGFYGSQAETEDLEPPVSPLGENGESYTVSPTSNTVSTDASRPDSPSLVEHAEDDTAIRSQPSRHVDYLSHNWREEDIWCSWQLIVSKRGCYSNSARLENASWRTWMKAKYGLGTVSPERLNWLKDCDVTWLYGPLQTISSKTFAIPNSSPLPSSRLSKSNSFLHPNKKPILKKRSMSEIMLQRSLSASSLLKQAAAAVQAQQSADRDSDDLRPCMGRATSDYIAFPFVSRRMSRENSSVLQSVDSSGVTSPSYEKKHIHFNEQVEQCIALDMSGGAADEEVDAYQYAIDDNSDSDSDDGAIMMKRSNSKKLLPTPGGLSVGSKKSTRNNSFVNGESKTIAMLPSTTLKYREEEPKETAQKHSSSWFSAMSPSGSTETLRPTKAGMGSGRGFLLGDDSDDEEDFDWEPPTHSAFANRKDSISVAQERMGGLSISETGEAGPSGMRRTPSGMFMPTTDSDDEDAAVNEGLFGKVVDTVNTAKDIAHVIWNVGWRR